MTGVCATLCLLMRPTGRVPPDVSCERACTLQQLGCASSAVSQAAPSSSCQAACQAEHQHCCQCQHSNAVLTLAYQSCATLCLLVRPAGRVPQGVPHQHDHKLQQLSFAPSALSQAPPSSPCQAACQAEHQHCCHCQHRIYVQQGQLPPVQLMLAGLQVALPTCAAIMTVCSTMLLCGCRQGLPPSTQACCWAVV